MNEDPHILHVEGPCTIYEAAALKARLLEAVSRHDCCHLDLAGVTELDSAGLQVLYLGKREAIRLAHTLSLVEHSAAVREVFDLTGLHAYFGDPTWIPARE